MKNPDAQRKKYEQALYYEIFIKEEYLIAKPTIKTAKTIFDIGGHIGLFSERCLSLNPKANIHYFEPFESLVNEAKIRLQSFSSQIIFNSFGVAKTAGEYSFLFNPKKTMQSSQLSSFLNPSGTLEKVHCENLNHYLENQKIGTIDLLKLDIEGMEFEVLFDLKKENREKIQTLLCEVHLITPEYEQKFPELITRLEENFSHLKRIPSPYSEKIGLYFCEKKG